MFKPKWAPLLGQQLSARSAQIPKHANSQIVKEQVDFCGLFQPQWTRETASHMAYQRHRNSYLPIELTKILFSETLFLDDFNSVTDIDEPGDDLPF